MASRGSRGRRAFTALAGMAALVAGPAFALDEVQTYGIAQFGGSGQCGNSEMTHEIHTETANKFKATFDFLKSIKLWDEAHARNNASAHSKRFTDSGKVASGNDSEPNAGADEADVIYVHTHGSHSASSPARTSLSMGKSGSGYACNARTDTHMRWNDDLDIAVIKACQSGDYDTWKNGGYRQQFTTSSSTFRMWNAFHGDSSCGGHVKDYVGTYASNSINDGVGENWIDEAYDIGWFSNDDDCPVSIVMGDSAAKRKNMYEYGGWRDRKNTGAKTGSSIFYIKGCDPENGRKLPE